MTIALTVGMLTFGAFYLFSKRELLRVILGMVLLGHAANLAIIAAGGTDRRALPFVGAADVEVQADPLPQAFVLTAIVIAFAITVLLLALAVTGRADDAVATPGEARDPLEQAASDARFPRAERHAAAGRIARGRAGRRTGVRP
ncbi:cation:proton antiporter [Micrococcus flavus]|uniref:Multicomponent Na+:H+ antiporter subunit C n=1 Tax=Micrococcus flavus TaxID=384602 RepID=A0A4Y8X5Y5_9MICC|nr:cation:proton antiporter subunit C [Micrococcus flavus]MBB4882741.1 multicomponent Na+:H+ antiporter subunit C [Micrococcus flavus]TFI04202.1 cation:proton antiporter [Micrococcus flavus]GGK39851.1 cation:proton antiporter [Micrococcus flavus]